MGYAIVSNKRIVGEEPKNWHIFKAEETEFDNNTYIKVNIKSECKELREDFFVLVDRKPFIHYLINDRKRINDIYVEGFYDTDKDNTFYYTDSEDIIRTLAAILGKKVCGTCVSNLYTDEEEN